MPETLLELEARLLQAVEARHKLLTGTQEITVSLHGYGATTYSQANIAGLERYINELKQDIAKKSGKSRRGIIRTSF